MKSKFSGYYKLSEENAEALWREAYFVFDTSFLLNLYRYSKQTNRDIYKILDKITGKIWIPYRVGCEFHNNRHSVISSEIKNYNDSANDLKEFLRKFESHRGHPFISDKNLNELKIISKKIEKDLDRSRKELESYSENDPILNHITSYFDGKVGDNFSLEDLKKFYKEGEDRYSKKIPPGYMDNKKEGDGKYGDLIVWKQIIQKSSDNNVPIIFVTDDRKEDWWHEKSGKKIGPRPELIQEFHDQANNRFHMYEALRFIRYSIKKLDIDIKDETIDEIRAVHSEKPYFDWLSEVRENNALKLINDEFKISENIFKNSRKFFENPYIIHDNESYRNALNLVNKTLKNESSEKYANGLDFINKKNLVFSDDQYAVIKRLLDKNSNNENEDNENNED